MSSQEKNELHPRNAHRRPYDFAVLKKKVPALSAFVRVGRAGLETIDFDDPPAVKTLNQALLITFYDLAWWDIPQGYLCPPVPGRADYIHHLADLLAESVDFAVRRGGPVRVLDIGVGANCIYPIIGHNQYGWNFVGTDTSPQSIKAAQDIIDKNPTLKGAVELRLQTAARSIFAGIIDPTEHFDLTMCNPPFHASARAASEAHHKRRDKMRLAPRAKSGLNFGGQNAELWCPGGEARFVANMIAESVSFARQVLWFSTLVSKGDNLPRFLGDLKRRGARQVKVIGLATRQKITRILAWTFTV